MSLDLHQQGGIFQRSMEIFKELGLSSEKVKSLYSLYCCVKSKTIYSAPARAEYIGACDNTNRI